MKQNWLNALLKSSAFGFCEEHQEYKFHEKNVFCIDCAINCCRHCKEAHSLHRTFQIYKYSYQDVVRHCDIHKYFDCSDIQTYVSNNEKIVHLKARPSSKDIKPTKRSKLSNLSCEFQATKETRISTLPKCGGACEECGKHLQDERNRFCSITCKISVIPEEPKNQDQGNADDSMKEHKCSERISEEAVNNQSPENEASTISVAETCECVVVNFRKHPRKRKPPPRPPFLIPY